MKKKITALALALVLLLSLCACGRASDGAFRTLEVLGTKQFCAICRGGDKLAAVVDAAMSALAGSGTLSALTAQWLGKDRCCLRGDAQALSSLAELPEPRTLMIGVERDYYPLAYMENGEAKGLNVDIAMALGALLGWETRVLSISPEEVETQLSSGNIDCALGFDGNAVRASVCAVGECYMESEIVLAVPADGEIKRLRELKGLRVGTVTDPVVVKAVSNDEKLTRFAASATEYMSMPRCLDALEHGWCAAVALDALMLAFYRGE